MNLMYLMSYATPEKAASNYLGQNRNEAFAKEGWDMHVYVPTPCRGLSNIERKKYSSKKYRIEKRLNGHLTLHRFSMYSEGTNPVNRAFRYLLVCVKHFLIGVFSKDARKCDIIFTNSTPPIQGAVAAFVKIFRKIPFVYNLQDIFPDSMVGTGLAKKGGFIWKIGRLIENFTYKHADKIIVISEDFKKNIMAKGVSEEKIVVIYNWVDENAVFDIPREQNKLIKRYGLDKQKFYITYSGNIGLTQNMDMLLDTAKSLSQIEDIHFVVIGEGAYKAQMNKRLKGENIQNVTMLPFQPYEDISHVFSLGDVGLVISKPGVGANSVPSKTWSIMSASRPVLASFDENELKTIIEENQCGFFVKAGDKNAFASAIIKLYENKALCKEYGMNGRRFVMNNLTKEVGTQKYVDVIKSVMK